MSRLRSYGRTITRSGYSETMTITAERERETETETECEDELPSLSSLLTSLDNATRSDTTQLELRNTIAALIRRAEADEVDAAEYLKLAVLIGFKRRNHDKSQAPGVGAGERACLRTILHEIYRSNPAMIQRVLALVPLYGSWRDLLVLGEMSYQTENELSQEISKLFASQLQNDEKVIQTSVKDCPSNACKYAPHEFRHTGSRKNRKAGKKSENRKIQAHLGDLVASRIFPSVHHPRPVYRKLLSSLNERLAKKGFLVEPLICRGQMNRIQFNKAPKGSLNKYRKAIMRNPEASSKWRAAMSKSDAAVVDVNELLDVASQILGDEDEEILSLMIAKCVQKLKDSRQDLTAQATKLLAQLQKESTSDPDQDFSQLFQELEIGSGIVVYPVVDSAGASQVRIIALLLSAYLIARAQGLSHFVFDGNIIQTYQELETGFATNDSMELERLSAQSKRSLESQQEIKCAENFLRRVNVLSVAQSTLPGRSDMERISTNVTNLVQSLQFDSSIDGAIRFVDVMFLTTSTLAEVQAAQDDYKALLSSLQNRPESVMALRTLCIHRLSQTYEDTAAIPLVMRPATSITDRSLVTLDLLLIMDLTGSMGAWMYQAKQHLTNIVNSLKDETGIGGIRVGFVGYRDYGDNGRTVLHTFVPIADSEAVLAVIRAQEPSGGGDMPEDVLAGFALALNDFNWQSDLRLILFVADAPAHGYTDGGHGDNFKSGRCPDQEPPHLNLEETCRALADVSRVDLLFCRLNQSTASMEEMFSSVYHSGGFGVLSISSGPEVFRSAILSTISSSILKALAPENISGLQTFSGSTASSLFTTVNSSLRESLFSISKSFRPKVESKKEVEEVSGDDEVGADGIELNLGENEDDDEKREITPTEPSLRPKKSRIVATASAARTDYERIMSDLNLEELAPVRLALGMPVEASLLDKAVEVLLNAGVTVQDLIAQNYPSEIVEAMTNSGMRKLEKI